MDATILAVGESAADKTAVLDLLRRAGAANVQDAAAANGVRELKYVGTDGPKWRILDPDKDDITAPSASMAILFVVDVSNYDQSVSPLQNSLIRFAEVGNKPTHPTMPVLRFFRGAAAMASKMKTSPLQKWFPDYDPGQDPAATEPAATMGVSFLASKFAQTSPREDDQIYAHPMMGSSDGKRELEFVIRAMEDIVEKRNKSS